MQRYILFFLSFFCAPLIAHAAATYTVQGNVYRVVDYVDSDAERIRLRTVLKGAAANETYAARVVPITQSRFASWFKPNLGSLIKSNLWWMGFVAIVESAGWAIDELKGQVQVVRRPAGVEAGYYWCPVDAMNNLDVCGISAVKSAEKRFSQWSFYAGDVQCGSPNYSGWVTCSFRRNDANYRGDGVFARQACSPGSTMATCGDPAAIFEPVPDADLQSLINSQLALDPAHAATAFTDPATGRGYDELFDPVPYIPGLTAADEALVNCYISGQLQMVNSQAACYVANQAEYDRIKQQTEALASARTPEATADALNADMKQPLTQAQYEESNKKYSDAIFDVTNSLPNNESETKSFDDANEKLDEVISGISETTLPAPADIQLPVYSDCMTLTLTDGNGHNLVFPSSSQCDKINEMKRMFGYFLAMAVVFALVWQLLNRPHG